MDKETAMIKVVKKADYQELLNRLSNLEALASELQEQLQTAREANLSALTELDQLRDERRDLLANLSDLQKKMTVQEVPVQTVLERAISRQRQRQTVGNAK
jgi:predicted nuclease with TOPRIM domain